MQIEQRKVGPGSPCFVIAEIGVNHNGDPSLARRLVDLAVDAGADAVKFQTFKADRVATPSAPKADYQKATTDAEESQFDMLRKLELSDVAHRELFGYCREKGIHFLSTPFDESCADFLHELGIAAFKIPSGEITNLDFLTHVARIGKPLIISTGMAYLSEVETAVRTVEAAGCRQFVLLHCVSNYPSAVEDSNLRCMDTLAAAFGVPVGFSDHTMGAEVSLAAVARGACVIEKHFTLDRTMAGPDHPASLEPVELKAMIKGIRAVESALGQPRKQPTASELETAAVARRSLVAACDIAAGAKLSASMIHCMRPGTGLPPSMRPFLIDRVARKPIPRGTLFALDMLQ